MKARALELLNRFDFTWNDYRTYINSFSKDFFVSDLAHFLDKYFIDANPYRVIDPDTTYLMAQLCYKLGTYYVHAVRYAPYMSISYLEKAASILEGEERLWATNQLALGEHLSSVRCGRQGNRTGEYEHRTRSLKILSQLTDGTPPKDTTTAFAYCVLAKRKYHSGDLKAGLANYKFAIDFYEANNLLDDQYARAKKNYAKLLVWNKDYVAASKVYAELESYWAKSADVTNNPYHVKFVKAYDKFKEQQTAELTLYKMLNNLIEIGKTLPVEARKSVLEDLVILLDKAGAKYQFKSSTKYHTQSEAYKNLERFLAYDSRLFQPGTTSTSDVPNPQTPKTPMTQRN